MEGNFTTETQRTPGSEGGGKSGGLITREGLRQPELAADGRNSEFRPPALKAYLLDSDSFAASTRALAKLSTLLSTMKAVTASFNAC
jgi:hypothetical protein